jgi:formylglycine-generating enzyme
MRLILLGVISLASMLLLACPGAQDVQCARDNNCDRFAGGVCQLAQSGSQWCAYPDPACPSGFRYSDLDVGDGLSGMCVMDADGGINPGPEMIMIPGGPFLRGCNTLVENCLFGNSEPGSMVDVATFFIDTTEVTQFAYKQCVDAGMCAQPSVLFDPVGRANHPVVNVTWMQAVDYCAFKQKRLPTEAEWEKASRGTSGHKHPWGNTEATCELAQYVDCTGGDARKSLPVGSKIGHSPYGVMDIAGNVEEWVNDWYSSSYYASAPMANPPGPNTGTEKVVRGGGVGAGASFLRSSTRSTAVPAFTANWIGFRCARN